MKPTLPHADVTVFDFNFTPVDCSSSSSAKPHVQFLQAFFFAEFGPQAAVNYILRISHQLFKGVATDASAFASKKSASASMGTQLQSIPVSSLLFKYLF